MDIIITCKLKEQQENFSIEDVSSWQHAIRFAMEILDASPYELPRITNVKLTDDNYSIVKLGHQMDWHDLFTTDFYTLKEFHENAQNKSDDEIIKILFNTVNLYGRDPRTLSASTDDLVIYDSTNDIVYEWMSNKGIPPELRSYMGDNKILDNVGQYISVLPDGRIIIDTSTAK